MHALQIRIPHALYEKLKFAAKENHRTINAEVCMHLVQADLPNVSYVDSLYKRSDFMPPPSLKPLDDLQGLIGYYEDRIEEMGISMTSAQRDLFNLAAIASRLQRLLARKQKLPESLLPLKDQTPSQKIDFHAPAWKQDPTHSFEELLKMRNEQQRATERDLGDITRARLAAEKCWREIKEMLARLDYRPSGYGEGEQDGGRSVS